MIEEVTNLWAYGWVRGKNPGQQVGIALLRGHYAVDQVTFVPVQCHYPVNLNHIPFVGAQDHYQVEQVYRDPAQEPLPGVPVRAVRQQGR